MKQTAQTSNKARRSAAGIYTFGLPENQFFLAIKTALVVLILLFVVVVYRGDSGKTVDMDALQEVLLQDTTITELTQGDRAFLSKTYGLDGTDYEAYLVFTAQDVMDVSELLVIKTSDADQQTALMEMGTARLKELLSAWENYGTTQYSTLQDAVLLQKGDCFILAISDNIDQWKEEILSCIG